MITFVILLFFPACMSAAIVFDFTSMRIPNRLCALLFAGYFGTTLWSHQSLHAASIHLSVFLCVLLVGFLLFFTGVMGGGDGKLMASTALWIGWNPILVDYLVLAGVLGGLVSLFALFTRSLSSYWPVPGWVPGWLTERACKVPFGVALGASGIIVYPDLATALLG